MLFFIKITPVIFDFFWCVFHVFSKNLTRFSHKRTNNCLSHPWKNIELSSFRQRCFNPQTWASYQSDIGNLFLNHWTRNFGKRILKSQNGYVSAFNYYGSKHWLSDLQKTRSEVIFITTLLQTMPEILRKRKKQNLTTPLGRKPPTPKRWRSGWLDVQEKYTGIEK